MMDLSSDITSLEEDIQDFNIERDVKASLKTQEELDKLTVDETLNDIDRSVFLLSSGQEIQCLSVIRNLPHLIKGWQNDCVRRVIPKVKELLHTAGLDIQIAATEVFTTIAKEDLLSTAVYTQHFLRTIITNMNTKDPVSAQAWLDCLISVISYLPRETVRREILGLAIAKGQLSQPAASRLSCCSILGAVASKFESSVVRKDIIHTVKQLCQDVEHNVRTCMCAHLHSVALALGAEETKKSILEEVLELAGDEESQVREAALDALLNMADMLDDETLTQSVVPIVCKFCEQAVQNEDNSIFSVTKNFGRFCHSLSVNFNLDQHAWLLSLYRHLSSLGRAPLTSSVEGLGDLTSSPINTFGSPIDAPHEDAEKKDKYLECRRHCAYNFPAVTTFCSTDLFQTELLDSLSFLCTDPDMVVRKHIAAGIHEVAQTLEANAHLIHPHVVLLLRERLVSGVLEACLKRLPDTLIAVVVRGNLADNKVNGVSELIGALLSAISRLEQQWPSAWRPLETLVTNLRRLPDVLTSDQIYYKFVPVVFKLLTTNRYLPVREAAACSVCVFIRHNRKMDQRREMCDRLVQDLCYSRNFRNRILFFTACRHMMVLFSRAYFKDHLFEHVLHLFGDPVPNVRLCLCKILPSMKALLKLPRDRGLHGQLEANVRKLLSMEKDRDVSSAIRQTIFELDRTEVAMESLTQHPLEVDLQDQRKEDEERMLIVKEEKTKDEDARSLRSHGSSHSSSSMGKAMTKSDKSNKKKRSTSLFSVPSSSVKLNGSKEKSKSQQLLSVPGSTLSHQKDNVLSSTGPSLPLLYNMPNTSSTQHQARNLANHFSHASYMSTSNNPALHGPSTALGHKGPHYPALSQTRNSSNSGTNQSSFMNSLSSAHGVSPNTQTTTKTARKTERRKAQSYSHPNSNSTSSFDISNPAAAESRPRKGSAGSASSTGSGGRAAKSHLSLRLRNSNPGSPVVTKTSLKSKKEKQTPSR